MAGKNNPSKKTAAAAIGYDAMLTGVVGLLDEARRASSRAVNSIMTVTYWEIGRRIVEYEQAGETRAEYGTALIKRMSQDLTARLGRGFSPVNVSQMRKLYQFWPPERIFQTVSEKSAVDIASCFPLPWSCYVRLMTVDNPDARAFYETEALRGGWKVRPEN